MDIEEAKQIIRAELDLLRARPYSQLAQMVDSEPITGVRTGPGGKPYQIEIEVYWDDKPGGNIRVAGAIDDGGWRAFLPICDDFIKTESDEFVGEQ